MALELGRSSVKFHALRHFLALPGTLPRGSGENSGEFPQCSARSDKNSRDFRHCHLQGDREDQDTSSAPRNGPISVNRRSSALWDDRAVLGRVLGWRTAEAVRTCDDFGST
jgi:hypothetical protein